MVQDITFSESAMKSPIDWSDMKTFIYSQNESKNLYIRKLYKNYYMYRMDRHVYLEKEDELRRSNINYPVTHMFTTRVYNLIARSDIYFDVTDKFAKKRRTKKDKWLAQDMQLLQSWLFSRDETKQSFWSAVFDAILIWRGILKVSYKTGYKTKKYIDKNWKEKEMTVKHDYPILQYVSSYDTYFDPWATSYSNMRFIIERKLLSASEIKWYLKKYWIEPKEKEIKQQQQYISYKDYNSEKFNMPFYNVETQMPDKWQARDITEDDQFNIKNKKLEVLEVHTQDDVSIYVNGVPHGTKPSVWPFSSYKHKIINFKKNPWTIYSLGVWYICYPLQETYNILSNLRVDNVKLTVNKVFLHANQLNITGNDKRFKMKPWLWIKVDDITSVKELQISEVKESAYRETNEMFQMVQGMTWVSSNALWLQYKVERTAWGASTLQEALDDQLIPLFDSISDVMAEVYKEFMILALEYMDNETLEKIVWPWSWLLDMDVENLINEYEFDFRINSNANKQSAVERQQLMQTIQVLSQLTDASGKPVADVRPLVDTLVEMYSNSADIEMDDQKLIDMLVDKELVTAEVQEKLQKEMEKKNKWKVDGVWPEIPVGWESDNKEVVSDKDMWNLQQLWGANIPPEFTTNPSGTNTPV